MSDHQLPTKEELSIAALLAGAVSNNPVDPRLVKAQGPEYVEQLKRTLKLT